MPEISRLKISANMGYERDQYILGKCYMHGDGVEKDPGEAVYWYTKAAERGFAIAQNDLAYCYMHGDGVEKDTVMAVQWYTRAAEQGFARAQNNLGQCYEYGMGVKPDFVQAYKWYNKAASNRDADFDAIRHLKFIYNDLASQIDSAHSEDALRVLALHLHSLNYENSQQLAHECEQKANAIITRYNHLLSKKNDMTNLSWKDIEQLAIEFRVPSMQAYKDSIALAEECDKLTEKAKADAYEQIIQTKAQTDNKPEPDASEYHSLVIQFQEFGLNYKDAGRLANECEHKAHVQEQKVMYNGLLVRKSNASSLSWRELEQLAADFRVPFLHGYTNSAELAKECKQLAEVAKAEAFEQVLQAKAQTGSKSEAIVEYRRLINRFLEFGSYKDAEALARECASTAYAQEQKSYYDSLVSRMAIAVTEEDFDALEEAFCAMKNYPGAVEKAEECVQKAKPIKYVNLISKRHKTTRVTELKECSERFHKLGNYLDSVMQAEECEKEASRRQAEYVSQRRCWNCGDEIGGGSFVKKLLGGLLTKKCKNCGETQQ